VKRGHVGDRSSIFVDELFYQYFFGDVYKRASSLFNRDKKDASFSHDLAIKISRFLPYFTLS
jgi:hypothetical protein